MSDSLITGVKIAGIACGVPQRTQTEADLARAFGEADAKKIIRSTGVRERRVTLSLCTSDLCLAAAERLLAELKWERSSITHLIFISQTPDYLLPATSCILHAQLGLKKDCNAFDVNLGCSGYVYGLWMASSLLRQNERALLLVGDISTHNVSSTDRSAVPLFGDCGSATALEKLRDCDSEPIAFCLGTDGTGAENIIVRAGGSRNPSTEKTRIAYIREGGNCRSDENLFMNGAEVFAFTLKEVPPLVERTLSFANFQRDTMDAFVFHQANRFILEHLSDKMNLPKEKVPLSLEKFGNTSSASIPLTLVTELRDSLQKKKIKALLTGFGVGWSWGAVALSLGSMVIPELIEVPELQSKTAVIK